MDTGVHTDIQIHTDNAQTSSMNTVTHEHRYTQAESCTLTWALHRISNMDVGMHLDMLT